MAKKLSITAKVRTFILENPTMSTAEVAKKFGVTSNRVSTIKWQIKTMPARNVQKVKKLIMEYTPPLKVTKPYVAYTHPKVEREPLFKTPADPVNHPEHYKDGGIETIDYIEAKRLGYHLGNAVKYISRAGKKGTNQGLEDLKKAQWYLNRAIEKNEVGPVTR
jgi:hypothetical protein